MPEPLFTDAEARKMRERIFDELKHSVPENVAGWLSRYDSLESYDVCLTDPGDGDNDVTLQLWPGKEPCWWSINVPLWLAKRLPMPASVHRDIDEEEGRVNYEFDELPYERIFQLLEFAAGEYAK